MEGEMIAGGEYVGEAEVGLNECLTHRIDGIHDKA